MRTIGVAVGVAFVCSLLVATAVYLLRPIQLAYSSIERNRAVLEAAGVVAPDEPLGDRAIVDRFLDLDVRIVDLDTDELTDAVDALSYDFRAEVADGRGVAIAGDEDIARLGTRPRHMPVYLRRAQGAIALVVVPIYGRGMWSTIYGYLSLEPDFATIAGIAFYEHGETPGIGDRIENSAWLAQWRGKRLFDSTGALRFRIAAGGETAAEYRVDAITGATVTAEAVDRIVRYWLGEDGFGPWLAKLRNEAS